ncbi:MAG: hypothetical protein H7Y11_07115, partial [Armatimonadetes bacterium]|nr:hypothetical protein [Anaerolineae bacterium]
MSNPTVRATLEGLRVRQSPVDGAPIGYVVLDEILESLETPEATLAKLGVEGQWLRVRDKDGIDG